MNGNTLDGFQSQIGDVKQKAAEAGRKGGPKFAINGFVIIRDTEEEALQVLAEIQGKADTEFVSRFRKSCPHLLLVISDLRMGWFDIAVEMNWTTQRRRFLRAVDSGLTCSPYIF